MIRRTIPWLGLLLLAVSWIWLLETPAPTSGPADARLRRPAQGKPEPLVIVLDPGHGGQDSGTICGTVLEKDLALDVARRTERFLRKAGWKTILTRADDRYLSLAERARIANREKNSIFVSIHFNEGKRPAASGVETYFSERRSESGSGLLAWLPFLQPARPHPLQAHSESLARFLQSALVERTQALDRGTKSEQFFVIANVHHPAALVEGGFLTNPADVGKLAKEDYREEMARALSEGVGRYREALSPNEPTLAWASGPAE